MGSPFATKSIMLALTETNTPLSIAYCRSHSLRERNQRLNAVGRHSLQEIPSRSQVHGVLPSGVGYYTLRSEVGARRK